jgi:hypothetical protein
VDRSRDAGPHGGRGRRRRLRLGRRRDRRRDLGAARRRGARGDEERGEREDRARGVHARARIDAAARGRKRAGRLTSGGGAASIGACTLLLCWSPVLPAPATPTPRRRRAPTAGPRCGGRTAPSPARRPRCCSASWSRRRLPSRPAPAPWTRGTPAGPPARARAAGRRRTRPPPTACPRSRPTACPRPATPRAVPVGPAAREVRAAGTERPGGGWGARARGRAATPCAACPRRTP